jgi:hypothetical protein
VVVAALRRLRSRRIAWLIAAQVVVSAGPATASVPDEDRVDLSVVGGTDEAHAFADALREPLQRLGLVVRTSSPARPDDGGSSSGAPPRARIWIDARPVDQIDIVVALGSSDADTARRSVPRGEPEPVVVDQVAYVVRETIESLLWTSQGTASSSPAPSLATEPADASSPSSLTSQVGAHSDEAGAGGSPLTPVVPGAFGVDVSAFATGRAMAPGADVLGGGVSLDFTFWGHHSHRPRLLIAASYDTPFEVTNPDVTLRVAVWSLRALPTVAILRWGALGLDAGVGAGLEALNAVPAPAQAAGGPPIAIASQSTVFDPVATGQLMVWLRPTGGVGVLLGAYADYDLAPHRYTTVDRFGQSSTVVEPWLLRPAVIAGFCIPLTGTSACARPDLRPR